IAGSVDTTDSFHAAGAGGIAAPGGRVVTGATVIAGILGRAAQATRSRLRACSVVALLACAAPLVPPALAQTPATLMADQVFIDPAGRLVAEGSVEIWHGSIR